MPLTLSRPFRSTHLFVPYFSSCPELVRWKCWASVPLQVQSRISAPLACEFQATSKHLPRARTVWFAIVHFCRARPLQPQTISGAPSLGWPPDTSIHRFDHALINEYALGAETV